LYDPRLSAVASNLICIPPPAGLFDTRAAESMWPRLRGALRQRMQQPLLDQSETFSQML
jgi:hypothetical protein